MQRRTDVIARNEITVDVKDEFGVVSGESADGAAGACGDDRPDRFHTAVRVEGRRTRHGLPARIHGEETKSGMGHNGHIQRVGRGVPWNTARAAGDCESAGSLSSQEWPTKRSIRVSGVNDTARYYRDEAQASDKACSYRLRGTH